MKKKELTEQEMIYNGLIPPWGFHKGNLKQKSKRQLKKKERLNTCAGLPAKRRSFVKLLKRHWKGLGLNVHNVVCVEHLSAIKLGRFTDLMFSRNQPSLLSSYGEGIYGYAAYPATPDGIMDWKVKIDPMMFMPKSEGLPLF